MPFVVVRVALVDARGRRESLRCPFARSHRLRATKKGNACPKLPFQSTAQTGLENIWNDCDGTAPQDALQRHHFLENNQVVPLSFMKNA